MLKIENRMFQFIVLLRAISAIVITNAHYENIYPLSIIANGGLLGDVLFFAISGFCLYMPKHSIIRWYGKRLKRIYIPVWIITLVYLALGFYRASSPQEYIRLLIYPTYYHFIASLLVLYVIYYIIMWLIKQSGKDNSMLLLLTLVILLVIHFVIYCTFYDRSYYHIDSVYEPMIRLLFLEAMLIGAIVRENSNIIIAKFRPKLMIGTIFVAFVYFASKLALVKYEQLAPYQIGNQMILLVLLALIFMTVGGIEKKVSSIPKKAFSVINYIASITLEIYLVQYALIPRLNIGGFPINFMIVTCAILAVASLLHFTSNIILKLIENGIRSKREV